MPRKQTKATPARKQTLIFLHGFRGDHHGVRFVASHLAKDYDVLLPDLPPFGDAPALDAKHDIEAYTNWLFDYITATCTPQNKPILVAHSMGAIVASHFAARFPDLLADKLILVSPITHTRISRTFARTIYYTVRTITLPLPKKYAKKFCASRPVTFAVYRYMISTRDKAVRKFIAEEHYSHSGRFDTAQAFFEAMNTSSRHDCIHPAHDIKGKSTCIIAGSKDQLAPTRATKKLAYALSADLHLVPDTGHLIVYEKPSETADIIRSFLAPKKLAKKPVQKSRKK